MKCIKLNDGSIQRVKEKKAEELIAAGAKFVSKAEWKKSDPDHKARKDAMTKTTIAKKEKADKITVAEELSNKEN